jgi:hypothetical protein
LRALTFSSGGRWLASVGQDTTAVVWDLPQALAAGKPLPAKLSARQANACWDDLAGTDAIRAYRAVLTLAGLPEQALPLLRGRLRAVPRPDPKRVARLIAQLDDDAFAVRAKAHAELAALGEKAEHALRNALKSPASVEARSRLEGLVAGLEAQKRERKALTGEALRELRAVEVLEGLGTEQACRTLRALAGGEPTARLTQEAKRALQRLESVKRGGK